MCVGQERKRQFRFGADGVEARCIKDDQTLLEQRMGKVDHRVAPARHLDQAVLANPVQFARRAANLEAETSGLLRCNPDRLADMTQPLLHHLGRLDIERHHEPLLRVTPVLADAGIAGSRLDRQQLDARRLLRVVEQFGRAHGRAPGRRRQDAVAEVGEEDGVDQFRLATRELGDEGHVQAILAQALEKLRKPQIGLRVRQVIFRQPALKLANVGRQARAPLGISGNLEGKCHGGHR